MLRYSEISSWIILGILSAIILYIGYYQIRNQLYIWRPINTIYAVTLNIPDFKEGEDPNIIIKRDITEPFELSAISEIRDAQTNVPICRKISYAHIAPSAPLINPLKLSYYTTNAEWFMYYN